MSLTRHALVALGADPDEIPSDSDLAHEQRNHDTAWRGCCSSTPCGVVHGFDTQARRSADER